LLGGTLSPRAGHLPFASDLIAALKPSMIVELGVSHGDTYFGFCQLVTEFDLACSVYGIDTWNGVIFDAVSRHNMAHYQSFSHLVRKTFDDALAHFSDESISLLNLEGLQPFEALSHTFDSWLSKVQPGGVVLLNDIFVRAGDAGASRLWNEIKSRFPHISFRNNNGLGVIGKNLKEATKVPFLAEIFNASAEEQERIRRYYSVCAERLELAARLGASSASETGYCLFQVFRSHDYTYETSTELSHLVTPGTWINLHLDLPKGTGDRPLRLDVANRPAVVDIASLALRKEDGHAVWTWNSKDVTDQLRVEGTATRMPETEFCRVLSLGASPHVFLPEFVGSSFEQPLELEIRLRVDLELSAVKEMNQKWAGFQKAKEDFELRKLADAVTSTPPSADAARPKTDSARYLAQARIDHEAKIRQITSDAEARLEALRSEHELAITQHLAQLEEERRNHQITTLEKENLLAQQPRMLQEISIAQGNVEELKAEIERLNTELANMEYDLSELRKLNARMAAALDEERSARVHMQDSSSWQLTKPLRVVGDLFGPRKKY
jgi:hypothetical protein